MGILAGMRISLVIAAHNEEAGIAACITSIQKALVAYPSDAEVLVVANACTDRTATIARGFPNVKVVEESQKGLSRARAAGFAASTGDLIANLDADILMSNMWIPFVMSAFEKDSSLVALSGPYIYYDLSPFHRALVKIFYAAAYSASVALYTLFRQGAILQGGNFVVRRGALEKIGGFDTSIAFYGEDTDIARRLSRIGKVWWTFRLPMQTSGRRLAAEGLIQTGLYYTLNYFSTTFTGKPYTKTHNDIRIEKR